MFIRLALVVTLLTAASSLTNAQLRPPETTKDEDPRWREEYEFNRLKDPKTGKIPANIRRSELEFARSIPVKDSRLSGGRSALSVQSLNWARRGPVNVGGRTRALGVDVTNESIMLAGGVSGGLWRSTDGGTTWKLVSGENNLHSISCIVQDTRAGHTDTWYYGTGELNGNSAAAGGGPYRGDGMYKSTDNGLTWTKLASTSSGTPENFDSGFDYMWDLAIDPSNTGEDVVYAATFGAVLRSTDGGMSWSIVLGAYSNTENNGTPYSRYADVVVSSAGVVYATLSELAQDGSVSAYQGIFRSTDGISWTNITSPSFPFFYNRVVFGLAPSNENVLYLVSETPGAGHHTTYAGANEDHSFWKYTYVSGDGSGAGGTWEDRSANLPAFGQPVGEFASQGGYDLVVKVKPDDENTVFLGGTDLFRSTNGFATTGSTTWIGGYSTANDVSQYSNHHPDQHAIVFSPTSTTKMYSGNDGGVQVTLNNLAPTVSWIWLNNGYLTSQFYSVAIDHATAGDDVVIGGTQDNGTWWTNTSNLGTSWLKERGGDGTFCAVADGRTSYYFSVPGANIFRYILTSFGTASGLTRVDPVGGSGYQFVNPFILDPTNTNRMYLIGGLTLWRNDDLTAIPLSSGSKTSVNWSQMTNAAATSSITAVAASTSPADIVYFGTFDGHCYRIDNAASGNPPASEITGGNFPADGYINCIAIDPANADRVIVVFSNYLVVSLFYTSDGGSNWTAIAGNLEQFPDGSGNGPSVRWAQILPGLVLAGTSTGLYSTTTLNGASTSWSQEGSSTIGHSVVEMIDYRAVDGRLVVGTHGNGIFSSYADLAAPAAPNPLEPPDNALDQLTSVRMEWSPPISASVYHLQVSADSLFGSTVVNDSTLSDTTGVAGSLANFTKYFWRVRARNSLDWSAWSATSRFTTGYTILSATLSGPWNLVSVPISAADYTVSALFPSAGSRAYAYENAYVAKDTLENGPGYWLRTPISDPVSMSGHLLDSAAIPLVEGWNLVGSISIPVGQTQLVTDPPGILISRVFGYDRGYRAVDTLQPLHGHWVKASAPGNLILSAAGPRAMPAAAAATPLGTFNAIEFIDASGNSTRLYVGMSGAKGDFTLPPAPAQGGFDVRYLPDRFLAMNDGRGSATEKILISNAAFPVTVRWTTNRQPFPVSLIAGGRNISMQSYGSVQVTREELTLRTGKGTEIPAEYALGQNFPNPFNPSTLISFQLPVESRVRLRIYDLSGREIGTIADGVLAEGSYERRWDAAGVASGVYFYRLEATSVDDPSKTFIRTRVMAVLK